MIVIASITYKYYHYYYHYYRFYKTLINPELATVQSESPQTPSKPGHMSSKMSTPSVHQSLWLFTAPEP